MTPMSTESAIRPISSFAGLRQQRAAALAASRSGASGVSPAAAAWLAPAWAAATPVDSRAAWAPPFDSRAIARSFTVFASLVAGAVACAAATGLATKLGSRKCSMALPPPRAAGMPTNPATMAPDGQDLERHGHRRRRLVRPVPPAFAGGAMTVPAASCGVAGPAAAVTGYGVARPLRRSALGLRHGRRSCPRRPPVGAEERQRHQAVHVERGHQRRHDGDAPDHLVARGTSR